MTVPTSKDSLTTAASNAIIMNGYVGSYYDQEKLTRNSADHWDIMLEGMRLWRNFINQAPDLLQLLQTASTFHLRETIIIRGEESPTDLSSLTKQELIFCLATRTDAALVKRLGQQDRIQLINTINSNTKTKLS